MYQDLGNVGSVKLREEFSMPGSEEEKVFKQQPKLPSLVNRKITKPNPEYIKAIQRLMERTTHIFLKNQ